MKLSKLFSKTRRESPKEEESINARLLIQAGFIDKEMAGVYSYLPLGYRVLKKIEQIVREEMEAIDGQEILMPALQPKENWQITGRWQGLDVLYKVKTASGQEFALGPTHEEIIVPLAKKYIKSYKDLPLYLYQIQTKFRNEPRAKSGLLRGREFGMKDLYSFHASEKDLENYYQKAKKAYLKMFKRLGLKTLIVEASGGTFSQYSHEFQVLNEGGEDTIFYCSSLAESRRECGWAQNKEICQKKEGDRCPKCGKKIKKGQAIEVGNTFKLGTKYSTPFQLKFKDQDGKDKTVIMGCYGAGPTRIMGAIVEVYHDDRGIVWPKSVAPYQVHLINLETKKQKNKETEAEKIYQDLEKAGVKVLYDDREDISAGEKFAEADLIGCPIRLVVSEKTLEKDSVEYKERDKKESKLVKVKDLIKTLG